MQQHSGGSEPVRQQDFMMNQEFAEQKLQKLQEQISRLKKDNGGLKVKFSSWGELLIVL